MEQIKLSGDILHIVTEERSISYRWEEKEKKLDESLQIVSITDMNRALSQGHYSFDLSGSLSVGMVLAKHPFLPDRYIDINKAQDVIFQDKLNCMFEIAKLLGVTFIEAKATFLEERKMEMSADGELKYKWVDMTLQAQREEQQKYAKRYEREERFSGEFTQEGYQKALEKAQKYGLVNDADIQYLLKQRNPDEPNSILQQSVKVEMTKELNTLLECAMSLDILPGVFSLKGHTKEVISSRKMIVLESKLVF